MDHTHGVQPAAQSAPQNNEKKEVQTALSIGDTGVKARIYVRNHGQWEPVTIKRMDPDGQSAFLGGMPAGWITLGLRVPKDFTGMILGKRFYDPQGKMTGAQMREQKGDFERWEFTEKSPTHKTYHREFELGHRGRTLLSSVATSPDENNLYVAKLSPNSFNVQGVAGIWDEEGFHLVYGETYKGPVYKERKKGSSKQWEVVLPSLMKRSRGNSFALNKHIASAYHAYVNDLEEIPEGYNPDPEYDFSQLTDKKHYEQVWVDMHSPARKTSYGYKKDGSYVYLLWEDLKKRPDDGMKRIPLNSVVYCNTIEVDGPRLRGKGITIAYPGATQAALKRMVESAKANGATFIGKEMPGEFGRLGTGLGSVLDRVQVVG